MREHTARAFHASLPDGQAGGVLRVELHAVVFEAAEGRVELPLHGLAVSIGGASDRIVFFSHPSAEGWSVTTTDRGVLDDPRLVAHPSVGALVAGERRRLARGTAITAAIVGAVALGALALFAFRGSIVRTVAAAVPVSVEEALGESAALSLAEGNVLEDEAIIEGVEQLTAPLIAALPDKRYSFTFRVLDDATVNAFALPGGQVVIHSGLILRADRTEEVLGVLAHEIAHVQERHGIRAILGNLGIFVVVQALAGDGTGVAAVLARSGQQLASLRFSRDFEREADDRAVEYLVRAGIDARGMLTLFEKLQADEVEGAAPALDGALSLLSTHPATDERIERLKGAVEASPRTPMSFDYAAFRASVAEAATTDD